MKSLNFSLRALSVVVVMASGIFASGHFAIGDSASGMIVNLGGVAKAEPTNLMNVVQDPVQQCIDTCHAFIGRPGPELRRCVADCLAMEAARWSNFSASKCETYEEDCDRGEDDPSNPSDPEPSDDNLF